MQPGFLDKPTDPSRASSGQSPYDNPYGGSPVAGGPPPFAGPSPWGPLGPFTFTDLLKDAWTAFNNYPGPLVIAFLINMGAGFASGLIPLVGTIVSLVITGPLTVGMSIMAIKAIRGHEPKVEDLFKPFQLHFGPTFLATVLMGIGVFLGILALIIPGIVLILMWNFTFFALADDPRLKAADALRRSAAVVDGFKWTLLGYNMVLSLLMTIGSILTCGLGVFVVVPMVMVFYASMYNRLAYDKGLHPGQQGIPGAASYA